MKHGALFAIALLASAVVACDPCAGVGSCTSDLAHLTADGQLVDASSGKGIDGVRIDMVRVGGPGETLLDSVGVVTSGGGFWRLTIPSTIPESVLVRFRIVSPRLPKPYTTFRWIVPTTRTGEAYVADRWVIDPYFNYFIQPYLRGRSDIVFPGAAVQFHQTGGPAIQGADANGNIASAVEGSGFVRVFPYGVTVGDTGLVEGDLTVEAPPPYGTLKAVLDLYPEIVYHTPPQFIGIAVGPSLSYTVAVVDRAGHGLAGVRVAFTRNGGIAIDPSAFTVTTDANGRAVLAPMPLASGTVTGTVTLTPVAGASTSFPVTLPTFDADGSPLFATWSIGGTT